MKRYAASMARERLSDVLDEADRAGAVVIERRGVQYVISPKPRPSAAKKKARPSVIETIDVAIGDGQWTWASTPEGAAFTGRSVRRPRRPAR